MPSSSYKTVRVHSEINGVFRWYAACHYTFRSSWTSLSCPQVAIELWSLNSIRLYNCRLSRKYQMALGETHPRRADAGFRIQYERQHSSVHYLSRMWRLRFLDVIPTWPTKNIVTDRQVARLTQGPRIHYIRETKSRDWLEKHKWPEIPRNSIRSYSRTACYRRILIWYIVLGHRFRSSICDVGLRLGTKWAWDGLNSLLHAQSDVTLTNYGEYKRWIAIRKQPVCLLF